MDGTMTLSKNPSIPAYLSRPGGMGERIRHFNWMETPLGGADNWKQSLRSALSICLSSNFPIGIYWGKELILLYNDAWSPIPGDKHPWALGRPAKEVWPEIWDAIEPQFEKAFSGEAGGSKDALLLMQRHGYTEECYFDFTFTPVYGENGHVDGIFNAVIETTYQVIDKRRTRFLQTLSRKISTASTVQFVFNRTIELLKSHPEDLPFCYFYLTDDRGRNNLSAATVTDSVPKNLPFQDVLRDGSSVVLSNLQDYIEKTPVNFWPEPPAEAMLVPLKLNSGEIFGFLFAGLSARRRSDAEYRLFIENFGSNVARVINNIYSLEEERKRTEEINIAKKLIEQSEEHFRSLTQALPQLVWVTDAKGIQEFASERWKEYTGVDPLDGNTWDRMIHPDDLYSVMETWNNSLQSGNSYKTDVRLKGKDGTYRWFHVHGEPIRNENNEVMKWVGAFTDTNEQKLAEEILRHNEERLEVLVRKRTEELQRSNEDLQQFAHVASHDLKEPIRKIKIYSNLLHEEFNNLLTDPGRSYLSKIQDASDRMIVMMDAVLRYAGLEGNLQKIDSIDLNEIMHTIESDLEAIIQQKKAVIDSDPLPEIQGYPVLIYQLFYNLVSNALKFSRAGVAPHIVIRYRPVEIDHKAFAEFSIKDNGIGFGNESAEIIFQTFVRLNTKEEFEGTGLGLPLCRKIASRHHGMLFAKGEPGVGAEFILQLPVKYSE